MTRILATIAAASFAMGATVSLAQADAKMMMEGYSACNSAYAQCVKDGTDVTLATTPTEGAEKIKMNMMKGQECGAAHRACYSSVK